MYIETWGMVCLFLLITYPIGNSIFKSIDKYLKRKERECTKILEEIEKIEKYFKER